MNVETRQYLPAPEPGTRKRRRPTGEGDGDSGRSKSITSAEAAVVGVHDFLSSMSSASSLPSAPTNISVTVPIQHPRRDPPVPLISTPADIAPRSRAEKNIVASPQDFLTSILKTRGYSGTSYGSLQTGYHNTPSDHQTKSYGVELTKAIRSSETATVRLLLEKGLHPNACNKFGESIVHAACRRGDHSMLRTLIEAGSSVQVTDDFGRTPLHDACWTSTPNFDTIRLLLDQDKWLLSLMDCRGSTPLKYVRKAHWALWLGFLGAIADQYWPQVDSTTSLVDLEPPLALAEPNSRPLPCPRRFRLGAVELLASGKVSPKDIDDQGQCTIEAQALQTSDVSTVPATISRITFDPLRKQGSNGTLMSGPAQTSRITSNMSYGSSALSPSDQSLMSVTANSSFATVDSIAPISTIKSNVEWELK